LLLHKVFKLTAKKNKMKKNSPACDSTSEEINNYFTSNEAIQEFAQKQKQFLDKLSAEFPKNENINFHIITLLKSAKVIADEHKISLREYLLQLFDYDENEIKQMIADLTANKNLYDNAIAKMQLTHKEVVNETKVEDIITALKLTPDEKQQNTLFEFFDGQANHALLNRWFKENKSTLRDKERSPLKDKIRTFMNLLHQSLIDKEQYEREIDILIFQYIDTQIINFNTLEEILQNIKSLESEGSINDIQYKKFSNYILVNKCQKLKSNKNKNDTVEENKVDHNKNIEEEFINSALLLDLKHPSPVDVSNQSNISINAKTKPRGYKSIAKKLGLSVFVVLVGSIIASLIRDLFGAGQYIATGGIVLILFYIWRQ